MVTVKTRGNNQLPLADVGEIAVGLGKVTCPAGKLHVRKGQSLTLQITNGTDEDLEVSVPASEFVPSPPAAEDGRWMSPGPAQPFHAAEVDPVHVRPGAAVDIVLRAKDQQHFAGYEPSSTYRFNVYTRVAGTDRFEAIDPDVEIVP